MPARWARLGAPREGSRRNAAEEELSGLPQLHRPAEGRFEVEWGASALAAELSQKDKIRGDC